MEAVGQNDNLEAETGLRREANAAEKVLEAKVGAQGFEGWIGLREIY